MHFPADRDLNYFSQLLAERSVLKVSGGQRYRVWEQLPCRANEALDCRVYSYAALCGLFYLGLKLNLLADNIAINPDRLLPAPQQPEENKTFDCPASSLKNRKTEAQAPVTTFAIIRIPMFNRNTSLLAGAMTPAQLQDALAKAQQAYFDLAAGARGVSFSYTQGDGTRSVSYQQASMADLMALIQLLQAQLGIVPRPRRPMRFRF